MRLKGPPTIYRQDHSNQGSDFNKIEQQQIQPWGDNLHNRFSGADCFIRPKFSHDYLQT